MSRIVQEIRKRLRDMGFSAFSDERRARAWLARAFPEDPAAAAACADTLFMDRYLDALLWLWNEPQTASMRASYLRCFERRIREGPFDPQKRAYMERANLLFFEE